MVWKKIILVWLAFIPIAILNGIIRKNVYQTWLGELRSHQLSTLIACLLFIILAKIVIRDLTQTNKQNLIKIGLTWVLLTIFFEFGFGHFVAGHSWEHLLADYNIFHGRIWSLFLVNELFTPFLLKFFNKNNSHHLSE